MESDHSLVAAIDFGTAYSGYAFSTRYDYKTDPLIIHANQAWNAGGKQLLSLKTPTVLLLDKNKEFVSFGYEAENRYSDLTIDQEQEEYYYFHRFKMKLHKNINLSKATVIEDITGKSALAMDVFSISIQALKDNLLEELERKGTTMTVKDIRWVLTVPAIWTDAAKQFMRKAAEKAGIPGKKLLIALEPEAASIYCQYLPTEKLNGADGGFSIAEVGPQYMIIDVGGGTVDITAHEKQQDGRLKELCKATGDACGGTSIDNEFFQLMVNIFGAPLMNSLSKTDPLAYLDLFREFETVKRTINTKKTGKINFTIPFVALDSLCKKNFKEDLPSTVSSCSLCEKISLRGDKMRIEADTLKALYSKSTADIVSHISKVIDQCESVSILVLVGGFSESEMIQHAIRKEFPDKRIIIPEDAGLSVLKGAVLFGQNPGFISSRVMQNTYGLEIKSIFNHNIHDKAKLELIDGTERCQKCFYVFKKLNESTPMGTKIKKSILTIEKFQKSLVLSVYVSNKEDPLYIDEPGCMYIGTVSNKVSNPSADVHYFDVEFEFGNTELKVKSTEKETGLSETETFCLL